MPRAKLLAFAQLLRLPNLFTAVADPLAGWLLTGGHGSPLLPVAASACLYTAGMVLNDCFDYQLDCRERPERPLPRGEISRSTAWILAGALMLAGLGCAALASKLWLALSLAAFIIIYNGDGKSSVVLGACRSLNLILGVTGWFPFWPPVTLGVYVAGLTLVARREVLQPGLRRVVKFLLLGIIVLDAGFVLAVTGDWIGAVLVLSLLLPALALGKSLAMT